MLYQDTRRYLKKNFEVPTAGSEWSNLENIKFFSYLEARYSDSQIVGEVSEIKQAFRDFFESAGKIVFRYSEDSGIKLKIFPYRVDPKDSKHLKKIIKIILSNRKYIEYPYEGNNDQIAIHGKIRRDINREIYDSEESVNHKELIKFAIRKALDLNERDVITSLKRKYIVKIFKKNSVLESDKAQSPQKREGKANRYNGYSAEEIEKAYKDIFHRGGGSIEGFLRRTMKKVMLDQLNFSKISNTFYEANALKILHSAFAKELEDYVSLESDFLYGVTGFLMRKHFEKIHEFMAIDLIEKIYDKETNANNFLQFYNGNIILRDNKKYQIPSLESQTGEKWNNATLIGICNLWMNTKRKKDRYADKLMETDEKISELEKTLEHIKPEKEAAEKAIEEASQILQNGEKLHAEKASKLKFLETTSLNSNEYFTQKQVFDESLVKVNTLKTNLKNAKAQLAAIKDANSGTYNDLEIYLKQKAELIQDIKSQELNIDTKNSQIDPILRSISRVLMARTKLVE